MGYLRPLLLLAFLPAAALGDAADLAGSLEANVDGRRIVLASLQSRYEVAISGDVATVRLTQTFENPHDVPINARYLFPLNRTAAVHAMRMTVGDEVISAKIDRIREARRTFERAKSEGKAAALLEQARPNMFTQRVANLMPGVPIEVAIEYTQTVPRIDGGYELVVPLIVGPRYQPDGAGEPPATEDGHHGDIPDTFGAWVLDQLPAMPPTFGVHLPRQIDRDRVSMAIELDTPVPIVSVSSATHPLATTSVSDHRRRIELAGGKAVDNRDFVLRYEMADDGAGVGLLSHWQPHAERPAGHDISDDADQYGGYFSLLVEPPATVPADETSIPVITSGRDAPATVPADETLAREMVFLLDCSGSMRGLPIDASKTFMRAALTSLRPTDTFRIIRFSDSATEFSRQPNSRGTRCPRRRATCKGASTTPLVCPVAGVRS